MAKVRSRGVELSGSIEKFMFNQLDLFAAITRVDSVIAADDGYGYGTGSAKSVVGNKTPGVSPLRFTPAAGAANAASGSASPG